ncbi:hypothetical protein BC835DRAFT_102479 [Cytidiella melzeri]|nr:hypothetical protein BC835DRAFT_102479 [Cytidiella melzeri]
MKVFRQHRLSTAPPHLFSFSLLNLPHSKNPSAKLPIHGQSSLLVMTTLRLTGTVTKTHFSSLNGRPRAHHLHLPIPPLIYIHSNLDTKTRPNTCPLCRVHLSSRTGFRFFLAATTLQVSGTRLTCKCDIVSAVWQQAYSTHRCFKEIQLL